MTIALKQPQGSEGVQGLIEGFVNIYNIGKALTVFLTKKSRVACLPCKNFILQWDRKVISTMQYSVMLSFIHVDKHGCDHALNRKLIQG